MGKLYKIITTILVILSLNNSFASNIPPEPKAQISSTFTSVCLNQVATITFSVANGNNSNAPYTYFYTVNGGTTQSIQSPSNNDLVTLTIPTGTAGTFIYQLTAANDSSSPPNNSVNVDNNSNILTITVLNNFTVNAGNDLVICKGQTINLSSSVSQYSAQVNYSWTGPSGFISNTQNPTRSNASDVMAGIYTVTATIGNCQVTDQVNVTVLDALFSSNNLQTFNNEDWLVKCTTPGQSSGNIFINNAIPSALQQYVTNYTINWGDGTPNFSSTNPIWNSGNQILHTYNLGSWNLTYSITTTCGTITKTIKVFVGNQPSNPTIQLQENAQGCAPLLLSFLISGVSNNIPGTIYTITFSDDPTNPLSFNQSTIPNTITHTFTSNSCNITYNGETNAFGVKIKAQNPCGSASNDAYPIRVSTPPISSFTLPPTTCMNQIVNTINSSTPGSIVSETSCNPLMHFYWEISPASGWSLQSGSSLGSNGGFPDDIGAWTTGSTNLSIQFTSAGTYTIKLYQKNSCAAISVSEQTIIVKPLNTIATGISQTVCQNVSMPTISLATTGATGATFSGLPTGVTGSWASNVATISGIPTVAGTFVYTVTTTGGCPPATTTGTITVNPIHTISAATNRTVCINTPITNITMTLGGGATGATVSGLPTGVTSSISGTTLTISGTPTVSGSFPYTVTTTGNSCTIAVTSGTITILPNNSVSSASYSATLCINTALSPNITHTTTGATGIGTTTGLPTGVTATWASNTITISGIPTVSGTFNYSIPLTGGCGTVNATGTITVRPLNTATAGITTNLCINTALSPNITHTTTGATGIGTATGLPAGVTATWTLNTITISGTPTQSGTFTYSIPLTGGCGTVNATGTITVKPLNTVTPGTTKTLCINTTITPNITHTTTGATGIGTSTGLPAGVTATWASNTITISGTPTASGTFTYSIPLTGGCGTVNATGTITVTPINTATTGITTNLCINTALSPNITHTTTGATGIGTATGLPAGVTATWASNTITISGIPTVSGTFNYSIPLTGGCGTVNATGTITVTPLNTATAGITTNLCINTALSPNITHTNTGATGIGTATGLPAGVTATWTLNTITISGTPTQSGTFTYSIPLTGGCGTVNATGTITVKPLNTVTPGTTKTLCINTTITPNITHTTTGATGIGTSTGLPAGVTATWASNTITISGTPTASGTFTYSIPLTGGCGTVNATGTITVTPLNTATAGITTNSCINAALSPDITHTTTGATGIGTPTGLPAGVTATWASNTITISGTPTVSGTFTYSIPLTGGCGTVNATGTITISINTPGVASSTPNLCINTALTPAITHTTTLATGIGTPTGLPTGVTATWASNTITISGTPTQSGTFTYSIPLTGGCGTVNATGTITVRPDNTVSVASSTPTLCINTALTPAITHTTTGATGIGTSTGLPAGVTAAWASNTITISGTPTASGTFTYSIPLTGGCGTINATGTITVTPLNTATAGITTNSCINAALSSDITHTTTGATGIGTPTGLPAGVTATWASNTITISGTPTVSGTFTYSIPLTGGCGTVNATGTITISINTPGVASSTPNLCINTALTPAITHTTTLATGIGTPTGLPTGVTATWASNTITISGTPTQSGTFTYSIPLTGGCGTVNATGTITVRPDNTVSVASSTPTLCINTALTPAITHTTTGATGIGTSTGLPAGVTAAWASNTITISGTPTASGTFTYSIPLTGGCGTVNATGTITVTPLNTATTGITTNLCINTALSPNITHTTTGATGIGTATGLPAGVTATWASNIITISGTPTVSGTFNYSIPLTGGCGSVNATGTITISINTPGVASSTPNLCINTALTPAITHTTTLATGIGTPTGLPTGVTATWASNTITISGTPTQSGTFTYSIPLTGGCGTVNATGTITVRPDNTVSVASSTPTLCINTALTPAITHTTTGATGIGTSTGLPAGVTAAWASNTITISGTPTASGTFTYSIPLTGGCGTINATGTITVTPLNTATAGITTNSCINAALSSDITHTTTGATGIGTPTGLPAGVTATWASNTITISGTPTVSGTFTYSIPLTGGCGTVNATGTITISINTPGVASSTPNLCINTALTPAITHTTTLATGIGTPTGLPTGVTATWASNTITISGTPTQSGTFTYSIPLTGGCGTVNATGTITVRPDNTVSVASSTPTLCINTALTPAITHTTTGATGIATSTGLPAGVTAAWASNTITISGTPTASGTFTYSIPLTGGCGTINATGTITVTPLNTATAGITTNSCINAALSSDITHTTTGATGIGTPTGLPAGVTATWASNTITISGTPTVSGTFTYSIPLTGGCGTVNATGTITISINTPGVASSTPNLCINTALTPAITHTTTLATGIGTPTGLPTGVTATWASNTITISGTPTQSGTFTYSIPLTGGCGTVNATGTITVRPDNTVSVASSTPTLCINTALTPAITHTTTGATGIGTSTGLPAGVTAAWASNTITISGTPTASGTFTYSIPLTGGCGTINATGTITVTPLNTATAGITTNSCINAALSPDITHTTTGATGIGTPTGLPAGVTATWASNTITISGTPTVSGTFTYSIPLTGGCGTVNATGTITISINTPGVASSTPNLCINTALTPAITHTTTLATGIGTPTGLPTGVTATWASNTITISGTPTQSGTFTYSIPLTGGCGTVNATGTITVRPDNTVSVASSTPTLCINTALTPAITHTTTGATGIGTSTGLPAGVTAAWASNTITISGTPTASGTFTYSIPLTGGCGTINATGTITVTPLNTATAGITTNSCINAALSSDITHTTTGATGIGTPTGLPAGVTATWASNTITISGTPTVSGTFTYSIPLTGGCGTVNATGTITISINTPGVASSTPNLCINTALTPAITHTTTLATGIGTPTGLPTGVTATWASNTITISGTPTQSGTFTYSIPLTGGCGTVNATGTITVRPDNTVSVASSTPTLCINTALTPAITHTTTGATGIGTSTGLPAGVTAAWASNTITISGTPTASGTFTYSIPLTGGCGTINATGTITVTPLNTATAGITTNSCINAALSPDITHTTTGATGIGTPTGLPAGVTATWASNTITISGTPTVSGTFTYSIPLTGGCGTVNATGTITISINTPGVASSTPNLCINTALTPAITHTTTLATGIGTPTGLPTGVTATWASNTITISGTPTQSGTFTYSIPLTGGCGTVNATGTITVRPDNTVSVASSTPTLCINTALTPAITHTTTGATGIGTSTGLPAGVTAAWASNTITISGTPTASGTFTYSIPLTGGCGTINATGTITVTPLNTATAGITTNSCINAALSPDITHTTTGATGIGTPTGLPAGVTATWASNTITISGTPTVSGTFTYSIPLTGGCGTVNATGTITISINTPGVASSTPNLCINTALTPAITHTTTLATGIGTPTGLPTGVTATWASNTITISGTPTQSGTFTYSIPLTGGCGTVNATGTIIVNPEPFVVDQTKTICSDVANGVILGDDINGPAVVSYNIIDINIPVMPLPIIASAGNPIVGVNFDANEIVDDAWTNTNTVPINIAYTVVPVSADGCEGNSFTVTLTINPEPLVVDQVRMICSDIANGVILGNDADGPAAVSYNIIDINIPVMPVPIIASAGNAIVGVNFDANEISDDAWTNTNTVPVNIVYTVVPVSASGCEGNPFTVTITVESEFVISDQSITVCSDSTNSIILGSEPTATYTITNIVSNDLMASSGNPQIGSGFSANEIANDAWTNMGTAPIVVVYTVIPQTSSGCSGNPVTITLTINPEPFVINQTTLICNDEPSNIILTNDVDGPNVTSYIITNINSNGLTPSGGNPNLGTITSINEIADDAWKNTTLAIVPVIYDITPVSADGCLGNTFTITLNVNPQINIGVTTTPITCYGANNASITLSVTGGTGPYQAQWDNLATGFYQNNLAAGDYTILITDSVGCTKSIVVNIPEAPIFTINPVVVNISCYGANDGSINLNLVGGIAPINLTWSDGSTAGLVRNNLPPGIYTVTIVDSKPCTITRSFTIVEPQPLVLSANLQNALDCNDANSGSINLLVSGGTPPFTYSWSNGTITEDLNNITAGNYAVLVTDSRGCTKSAQYSINRPQPLALNVQTNTDVNCETREISQVFEAQVSGGVPPVLLNWSSGTVSGANNEFMTTEQDGLVILTATDAIGCSTTYSLNVDIPVIGNADFNQSSYGYTAYGIYSILDPIQFTNTATGDYVSILWDFGDGTFSNEENPIHTYILEGDYVVTQTVTYPFGCVYVHTISLIIEKGYVLVVPTAFTPNNDTLNDTFRPVTRGLKNVRMDVYDTWGSLIYSETGDVLRGWDGTIRGIQSENGNYNCKVSAETFYGKIITAEETFVLIK